MLVWRASHYKYSNQRIGLWCSTSLITALTYCEPNGWLWCYDIHGRYGYLNCQHCSWCLLCNDDGGITSTNKIAVWLKYILKADIDFFEFQDVYDWSARNGLRLFDVTEEEVSTNEYASTVLIMRQGAIRRFHRMSVRCLIGLAVDGVKKAFENGIAYRESVLDIPIAT